jgi:hypothetical protein
MLSINELVLLVSNELARFITGRLFTEKQIRSITSHAVGKYLTDWFPEPEEERKARERVEEAKQHISEASTIISAMQTELINQSAELDKLLEDIEEKRKLAERYANLARTSEEKFSAFRLEIEEVLRKELRRQSEQGKIVRQIISISFWFITLILGAALGTYFKEVIAWIISLFD